MPPIPRGAQVQYKADPLSLSEGFYSGFYFDVAKPTRSLTLNIICENGIFILDPVVKSQPADELTVLGEQTLEPLRRGVDYTSARSDRMVTIEMKYPEISTRYLVVLDARPSA
jgi:hypothetical protein